MVSASTTIRSQGICVQPTHNTLTTPAVVNCTYWGITSQKRYSIQTVSSAYRQLTYRSLAYLKA